MKPMEEEKEGRHLHSHSARRHHLWSCAVRATFAAPVPRLLLLRVCHFRSQLKPEILLGLGCRSARVLGWYSQLGSFPRPYLIAYQKRVLLQDHCFPTPSLPLPVFSRWLYFYRLYFSPPLQNTPANTATKSSFLPPFETIDAELEFAPRRLFCGHSFFCRKIQGC